jgi:hypothetical protein
MSPVPPPKARLRARAVLATVLLAEALVGVLPIGQPSVAATSEIRLVCRLQDSAILESSGLAVSGLRDVFWTLNDSGDVARIFAFDQRGRTLTTLAVPGAVNLDWEELARGPGPVSGRDYLYLGDIGDNLRLRGGVVQVYRIPEPRDNTRRAGAHGTTAAATRFDLRYPDGAHDAEAMFIHPRTGDLYIITKERSPPGHVFRARAPLRAGNPIALEAVGDVPLASISAAAISPDGNRVIVRAYEKALEYRLPARGTLEQLWSTTPVAVRMPAVRGGEAITYRADGRAVYTSSEGEHAPIHEIELEMP